MLQVSQLHTDKPGDILHLSLDLDLGERYNAKNNRYLYLIRNLHTKTDQELLVFLSRLLIKLSA